MLADIRIGTLWLHKPKACWLHLAQAIRHSPKLESIHVYTSFEIFKTPLGGGSFAKEFIKENQTGRKEFKRLREENEGHPIEKVGTELRKMMSWLKEKN